MPLVSTPRSRRRPARQSGPGSRTSCAGTAWTCNPSTSRDAPSPAASGAGAGATICLIVLGLRPTACRGGRAYVRNGSVCHLDVHAGGIETPHGRRIGASITSSCASGSSGRSAWKAIRAECAGRVARSVLELLRGAAVRSRPARRHRSRPRPVPETRRDYPHLRLSRLGGDVQARGRRALRRRQPARRPSRAALPPAGRRRRRPGRRRHGVAGRRGGGRRPRRRSLADIFGIDLDPADSGAAAARQPDHRTPPAPPREAASDRRPAVRVPAYGPPGGGATPPGRILGPRVRRPAPRIRVDGVPLGSGPRASLALRAGQEDALQVLYRAIEKRQT